MTEKGRICRNAAVIGAARAAAIAFSAGAADYTTDGRVIIGMGGNCARATMNGEGRSNPVTCNPADCSTYGALDAGACRRPGIALFRGRDGAIVASEDHARLLIPAGDAAHYWKRLIERRERYEIAAGRLRRASDVGMTVTTR